MTTINKLKKKIINSTPTQWMFVLLLLAIFLAAAFLRFYRLEEFITFLGDQGRDALVMRRIVTLEDFPGIGPRSSIGQLFLGPFYFYFMAPFLLLFNFDPLGLAVGSALISLTGLAVCFFAVKSVYNKVAALFFVTLIAFSAVNVEFARFSWNPNLLPVFAFLAFYFFYRTITRKGYINAVFCGIFFGAALQLHYLMLLTLPPVGIFFLYYLLSHRKDFITIAKKFSVSLFTFIAMFAPLILFDLKNNFLNLRGIIGIFTEKQFESERTLFERFVDVQSTFLEHIFKVPVSTQMGVAFLLLLILITIGITIKYKDKAYFTLLNNTALISYLCIFSLVDVERFPHYYSPVYYFFFLFLASTVFYLKNHIIVLLIAGVLTIEYILLNYSGYGFLKEAKGNFQTHIAEDIAQTIYENIEGNSYYLISVPLTSTNDHIRYYLEVKGKRPDSPESTRPVDEMIILCYEGDRTCNVMDEPQYQVVIFGDKRIGKVIKHQEVTIYKMLHAK